VVDTVGNRTGQTDVVVTGPHRPYTWTESEPALFFVEGVVAAGEVKSVLTTQGLEQSIISCSKFRQLVRSATCDS